jgi:hypothetical protein
VIKQSAEGCHEGTLGNGSASGTPDPYQKGHIPGAWFASGPELARDLRVLDGGGPIVLTIDHSRSCEISKVIDRDKTIR